MSKLDKLFFVFLGILSAIGLFGIYHLIFIADTWMARIGVFFAYGCSIAFLFMAGVFWFAMKANQADIAKRRQENQGNV